MKKNTFVIYALLSIFLFSGCGNAGSIPAEAVDHGTGMMVQRPEREPDLMGMVSNMVGNQVTILLFNEDDMPFNRNMRPEGGQEQGGKEQRQNSGLNPGQALGATGGGMPGMGPGAGMGRGMRAGTDGQAFDRMAMEERRKEMLKELKAKSIGSETITIPVGIPIAGGGRPGGEPGINEQLSFMDIAKDSLITVWLNQEIQDKKVAEFVALMGRGMAGGNRINNQGAVTQN